MSGFIWLLRVLVGLTAVASFGAVLDTQPLWGAWFGFLAALNSFNLRVRLDAEGQA